LPPDHLPSQTKAGEISKVDFSAKIGRNKPNRIGINPSLWIEIKVVATEDISVSFVPEEGLVKRAVLGLENPSFTQSPQKFKLSSPSRQIHVPTLSITIDGQS
jgi:hypothetical protein